MVEETTLELPRVAVIGAGTMGAQIASLCASSGRDVALFDALEGASERGLDRASTEILPGIESAGMFPRTVKEALAHIQIARTLDEAVTDADIVIEAVREHLETKLTVFSDLSRLCRPDTLLTTNSSSLPSSPLAEVVAHPQRLLNTHFFAPVWIRSLLELMTCGRTSNAIMESALRFGRSLGLVTAVVHGESKGFIINRIWRAVKRESLRVIDEGVASPEDVDRLWMIFFQTKHAPFGIMDMVGLDVVSDIETSYQNVSQDPTDLPSPTLRRMIDAGTLGEKTGQGFYSHPNPEYLQTDFLQGGKD